jgi:uncharacterized membrane protein YtjA (UPF0391 family)
MTKSSIVIHWSVKIASKIFLALFVISLVVSLTGPGSEFLGGILKPASTIFFMLFVILMIFGKEIARYDEDQHRKPGAAPQKSDSSAPSKDTAGSSEDSGHQPALTSAPSR